MILGLYIVLTSPSVVFFSEFLDFPQISRKVLFSARTLLSSRLSTVLVWSYLELNMSFVQFLDLWESIGWDDKWPSSVSVARVKKCTSELFKGAMNVFFPNVRESVLSLDNNLARNDLDKIWQHSLILTSGHF